MIKLLLFDLGMPPEIPKGQDSLKNWPYYYLDHNNTFKTLKLTSVLKFRLKNQLVTDR